MGPMRPALRRALGQVWANGVVAPRRVCELRVGESDLGKVIGKRGKTLHALRTILSGIGTKENGRGVLEIQE